MTDIIQQTFNRARVVLPVIHVVDQEQTLRNVKIARAAGVDGVFLISHAYENAALIDIARSIKDRLPKFFLGLNLLGKGPLQAYYSAQDAGVDGVWVDNPEDVDIKNLGLLYFGGVAFKTHVRDEDLAQLVTRAATNMDVVCTSGPRTGVAEDARRLRIMSEALVGVAPLAVASGVTPQNVQEHLDAGVQAILVATGVSRNYHELDLALLTDLVKQVHRCLLGPGEERRVSSTKLSKEARAARAPRPPEELVGALQDRIHPTSGRLLAAKPIATTRRK